jgi:crotonobetaine/carnitine-CoA ligase
MEDDACRAIPFAARTLPAILQARAALGGRPFIKTAKQVLSYEQAPALAARIACQLKAAGTRPGDRIAALCGNRIELLQLWLGAAWAGAVLAPLNIALRGQQLRHALHVTRPTSLFTERTLLEPLGEVAEALGCARNIWLFDDADTDSDGPDRIGRLPLERWTPGMAKAAPEPVGPGDAAAILFTSGTSGPSKGVVCPHAQFYWWGVHTGKALGLGPADVLYTTLPFFHTNALNTLWQALLVGATYSFGTRFSASGFWQEIRRSEATVTYMLGAMVHILLKRPAQPDDREHRLRVALSPATAQPLVEDFQRRFGVSLIDGYGSTETNLVLTNAIGDHAPGTLGRLVDGFEARVVDEQDCEVPAGTSGELVIRHREPFSISTGYFDNPVATSAAWRNLWFHTGDRVIRDSNDVYHFLDRLKDSIRRRGENISSWEVEQALMSHEKIESAAVVGVPAEVGEEEVMAFIVLRKGARADPCEITQFLESRLAYFAIPRYIEFISEMPRTENGKVKKYLLREHGPGAQTWDRARSDMSQQHSGETLR